MALRRYGRPRCVYRLSIPDKVQIEGLANGMAGCNPVGYSCWVEMLIVNGEHLIVGSIGGSLLTINTSPLANPDSPF